MARKSKDDWKTQAVEVKAQLADARKKQQNFALLFADEGMILETDPRLPADNLKKRAKKKDGASPKGVVGTLRVQGASIEFTCAEEPPGGTEPRLKQWLALMGLKMRPILILPEAEGDAASGPPDGNPGGKPDARSPRRRDDGGERATAAEEQGGAGDGEAAAPASPEDEGRTADGKAGSTDAKKEKVRMLLMKQFGDMKGELKDSIQSADPTSAEKLRRTAALFVKSMKDDDLRRAAKIKKALEGAAERINARPRPGASPAGRGERDSVDFDETAAEGEAEPDADIAAVIAAARKRTMNFAWMIGDGDLILRAHRRKPVEKLVQDAKSAGAGARGAWGVLDVRGKTIILTCENEPPEKALIGLARKQFKEKGLAFRITFRRPEEAAGPGGENQGRQAPSGAGAIAFKLTTKGDPDADAATKGDLVEVVVHVQAPGPNPDPRALVIEAVRRYFGVTQSEAAQYVADSERAHGSDALFGDIPPDLRQGARIPVTLRIPRAEAARARADLTEQVAGLTPELRAFIFGDRAPGDRFDGQQLDDVRRIIELAEQMTAAEMEAYRAQARGGRGAPEAMARALESFVAGRRREAQQLASELELFNPAQAVSSEIADRIARIEGFLESSLATSDEAVARTLLDQLRRLREVVERRDREAEAIPMPPVERLDPTTANLLAGALGTMLNVPGEDERELINDFYEGAGGFSQGAVRGYASEMPDTGHIEQPVRNWGEAFAGYLYGLASGVGAGFIGIVDAVKVVADAVADLGPEDIERARALHAALAEFKSRLQSNPAAVGAELGDLFGQALADEVDEYVRDDDWDNGSKLGEFHGALLFEVISEVLLAWLTSGAGNVARRAAQAVRLAAQSAGAAVRGASNVSRVRRALRRAPSIQRLLSRIESIEPIGARVAPDAPDAPHGPGPHPGADDDIDAAIRRAEQEEAAEEARIQEEIDRAIRRAEIEEEIARGRGGLTEEEEARLREEIEEAIRRAETEEGAARDRAGDHSADELEDEPTGRHTRRQPDDEIPDERTNPGGRTARRRQRDEIAGEETSVSGESADIAAQERIAARRDGRLPPNSERGAVARIPDNNEAEALRRFQAARDNSPDREVALFRNTRTGDWVLVQGDENSVPWPGERQIREVFDDVADDSGLLDQHQWEGPIHTHPVDQARRATDLAARVPSWEDIRIAVRAALRRDGGMAGGMVEFVTEEGREVVRWYVDVARREIVVGGRIPPRPGVDGPPKRETWYFHTLREFVDEMYPRFGARDNFDPRMEVEWLPAAGPDR